MRFVIGRRESIELTRDLGQKSHDVQKGRKERQAERDSKAEKRKRQKMARDEDQLRHAMHFTKDWVNVTGMPVVACDSLANFEVFGYPQFQNGKAPAVSHLAPDLGPKTRSRKPTFDFFSFLLKDSGMLSRLAVATRDYAKKLSAQNSDQAGLGKKFDELLIERCWFSAFEMMNQGI